MSKLGTWRPIYQRILLHRRFTPLSPEAKVLWITLKLMLPPEGLGRLWKDDIAERATLSGEAFLRARQALVDALWLRLDTDKSVYWLINGFSYEPAHHGPNQLRGVLRRLGDVPGSLPDEFTARYSDLLDTVSRGSARGSGRGSRKGSARGSRKGSPKGFRKGFAEPSLRVVKGSKGKQSKERARARDGSADASPPSRATPADRPYEPGGHHAEN